MLHDNFQAVLVALQASIIAPMHAWGFWEWIGYTGACIAILTALWGVARYILRVVEKYLFDAVLKFAPKLTMLVVKQTLEEINRSLRLTNHTKMLSVGFRLVADFCVWASGGAVMVWLLEPPFNLAALILFARAVIAIAVLRNTLWIVENLEGYIKRQRVKARNISILLPEEARKAIDEQFETMLKIANDFDKFMLGSGDEVPSTNSVDQQAVTPPLLKDK